MAIVGAGTLKGKEVVEMLNERNFPAVDLRLLDDDESIGQLEATGDEINFIQSVRAEQFTNIDFTFFAADAGTTRQSWKRAHDAGSAIVDLSGALEEEPGATVRSLWVERERGQVWQPELQPAPCVVAHPASVALALLLLRARKAGAIRNAIATVFEPASEQGQKGMDELHHRPSTFYPFNRFPKICSTRKWRSTWSRATVPARSCRSIRWKPACGATIKNLPDRMRSQPALMALQPPVFHGHALSIFLEMEQPVDQEKLSQALSGDHVTLAGSEDDSQPSNVNAAGQANIMVSLKPEPSRPNGIWLWAAADNLRVAAVTAVECAESMIATRPVGKIQ